MKTTEYLDELKKHLHGMPANEIEDILRDQQEYIRDAIQAGRTEEQAIAALGEPKAFAANLSAEMKIQKVETSKSLPTQMKGTVNAVVAILALAPLNLIFVLGPFLGLVGIATAGWVLSLSSLAVAGALLLVFFTKMLFVSAGIWAHVSAFFLFLGVLGLSLLAILTMYKVTQWFVLGTLAYLKWNLNFIRARA